MEESKSDVYSDSDTDSTCTSFSTSIKQLTYDDVKRKIARTLATLKRTQETCERTMQKQKSLQEICTKTSSEIQEFNDRFSSAIKMLSQQILKPVIKPANYHKDVKDFGKSNKVTDISQIADLINSKEHLIIFTGENVAKISGVPSYFEQDGVEINDKYYMPQEICKYKFIQEEPEFFWSQYELFYQLIQKAKPNEVHKNIANLQYIFSQYNRKCTLLTSCIDDLHTKAHFEYFKEDIKQTQLNTANIYQINGNVNFSRCSNTNCNKVQKFPIEKIQEKKLSPKCLFCKSKIRPNVIFIDEDYNEQYYKIDTLNKQLNFKQSNQMEKIQHQISQKQCIILIGTSLNSVYVNQLVTHCLINDIFLIEISQNPQVLAGKHSYIIHGNEENITKQLLDTIIQKQ